MKYISLLTRYRSNHGDTRSSRNLYRSTIHTGRIKSHSTDHPNHTDRVRAHQVSTLTTKAVRQVARSCQIWPRSQPPTEVAIQIVLSAPQVVLQVHLRCTVRNDPHASWCRMRVIWEGPGGSVGGGGSEGDAPRTSCLASSLLITRRRDTHLMEREK